MREVPYETDQDVRARSRRDEMYERINDFLARGGRGRSGRGGRGRGMMNRIGYKTYDTTTTGMNKEVTVNVIDMMKVEVMMKVMATMKKNVCFLCKCLE